MAPTATAGISFDRTPAIIIAVIPIPILVMPIIFAFRAQIPPRPPPCTPPWMTVCSTRGGGGGPEIRRVPDVRTRLHGTVQPAAGSYSGTCDGAALAQCPESLAATASRFDSEFHPGPCAAAARRF